MPAPDAIDCWFEFASTYSYLGVEAAAQLSQPVRYQPFLLGPIFAAQGMHDSPFNLYPIKGRYMWRDMERLCEAAGLPWRRPSQFPRNGLLAARVALANQGASWMRAFCRAVYRANFAEDREIAEPGVLVELLTDLGLPARELLGQTSTPEVKQALRAQNERATLLGIFGAPTWVVGRELFWGSDRLQQATAWFERSIAPDS